MRLVGMVGALLVVAACGDDVVNSTTLIDNVMVGMDAAVALDAALDGAADALPAPGEPPDARVLAPGLGCPAMWDDCSSKATPWRVIAQASQFGAGARFRALSGDLVLVEGGDAPWRVVQIGPDLQPGQPSFLRKIALPAGSWQVRGLARTAGVAVIACGTRCALLEGTLAGGVLREVAGGQLPVGYQVLGLRAAGEALCVFGTDVSCFVGGRWMATLTPGEEVVALALSGARAVALARSGRVFAGQLAGALPEWQAEPAVAEVDQVELAGRRSLFSGAQLWVERTDGQDHGCVVPDGVAAVLVSLAGGASVLTGSGDLLTAQAGGFCRSQQLQLGEVVAASSGACGGEPRVISETQLIGDNRCDLQ